MLIATLIMACAAVVLSFLAYKRGCGAHVEGFRSAAGMMLQIVPLLFFAFIVAGMARVLLPEEMLSRWVGRHSGLRGVFLGSIAGGLCPGGPYVSMPVAAGLLKAGAGVGTMVAFMTAWSLWAVARLPMEVGILGWKFTLVRLAVTVLFPPLAGLLAMIFFRGALGGG